MIVFTGQKVEERDLERKIHMSFKLMIVSESQSYLANGLKEKFDDAGFESYLCVSDINIMNKAIKDMDAILLYCDDRLMTQGNSLNFIKDSAVENDITIFLVGNREELDNVEKIIKKDMLAIEFLRPISIPDVIVKISDYMKNYNKNIKKKILVVDDSGTMLRNVKGWLQEKYQVICANSGAMAIKYLALSQPDLILLDYEMPVVDGKQVLAMIRGEKDFAHLPVIFLTSKGDKESVMEVMSLKPEGYLLKTLPPVEVIKAIDDYFERKKIQKI